MSSSSSIGGPDRTFIDHSSSGRDNTVVPRTSVSVCGRIASMRPGTMWSVSRFSAATFSSWPVTSVAVPNTTTER